MTEIKVIQPEEQAISVNEAVKLGIFDKLNKVNILLTNKCNLRCDYCYEQHKKDFGEVTVAKVKKVYDFLKGVGTTHISKDIQFFGGEPLLKKQVILNFLAKYKEELEEGKDEIKVNMVSNGTLLDSEFLNEYSSYSFTRFCFSIDTFDPEKDQRGVDTEELYNTIATMFSSEFKLNGRLGIRCTLSPDNVSDLVNFIDKLYAIDVRSIIVHPLTFSATEGLVTWSEETWDTVYKGLQETYKNYPDFSIEFAEGVGHKGGSNCMIASDMMAIDGSGEYTGCYFFTNNKVGLSQAILGNIFEDKVYINNYKHWIKAYDEFFDNDTCKACNIRNLCYSCPAGNMTVFGQPYSNYKACSEITEFHVKLKAFQNEARFEKLVKEVSQELESDTLAVRLVQQNHKYVYDSIYMKEDIRKDGYPSLQKALRILELNMCGTNSDNSIVNIYNSLISSDLRGAEWLPKDLNKVSTGYKPQLVYVISALEMILFNKWSETNENNELKL